MIQLTVPKRFFCSLIELIDPERKLLISSHSPYGNIQFSQSFVRVLNQCENKHDSIRYTEVFIIASFYILMCVQILPSGNALSRITTTKRNTETLMGEWRWPIIWLLHLFASTEKKAENSSWFAGKRFYRTTATIKWKVPESRVLVA